MIDTSQCGQPGNVCVFQDGNVIRISPLTADLEPIVAHTLQYTRRSFERVPNGPSRGKSKIVTEQVLCFEKFRMGQEWHAVTNSGYLARLREAFKEEGYNVIFNNVRPRSKAQQLRQQPNWDGISEFLGDSKTLRPGQLAMLQAVVEHERGRVWWATGVGKSHMVPLLCRLYPKANIVITTRFQAPLDDLFKNLRRVLPSVGIYCSKKKHTGKRVMCVSAGCLHHINPDTTDILIADEIHELATDKTFEQLARFRYARMYGLSANMDDRFDGADFELEGIFGAIIAKLSYEEGVADGSIVPIKVKWRSVNMDDPVGENKDEIYRLRHGLWRNETRNALIAKDAELAAQTGQVLITVKTFEHACFLKGLLPDYELVYSTVDREADISRYIRWGLLPEDEPTMTVERLDDIKAKFESGKLQKAIATTVWNRGVNFKQLTTLIRGDGGSSAINDTQIPGRLSRTIDGKTHGVLIDYLDQFNDRFNREAKKRMSDYTTKGWSNLLPSVDNRQATDARKRAA